VRKIPYDPNDLSSINVLFFCARHHHRRAFMGCPACEHFPCDQLEEGDINALKGSPLMEVTIVGLAEKRRGGAMVLIRKTDGTIVESDIDINHPQLDDLKGVAEVLVVSKVLVPTIVLRPKPKEERDKIVAARQGQAAGTKKTAVKR
jgi:hypothetical protein